MPLSKVDISAVQELNSTINTFTSQSDMTLSSFRQRAMSLLAEMEAKLAELARIMAEKEAALNRCELRRNHDKKMSCAAEESAYERARARHDHCAALVNEARAEIKKYDSSAMSFRQSKMQLVNSSTQFLTSVSNIIHSYVDNAVPPSVGSFSSSLPGTGNYHDNLSETEANGGHGQRGGGGQTNHGGEQTPPEDSSEANVEPPSAIHISGGGEIAFVGMPGGGVDPVRIDPDAMQHSLEHLPPITAPSHDTLNMAAAGIVTALTAGGLIIGGREMLFRRKTDELFEAQYGITPNELMVKSNGKDNPYIHAYNDIHRGLQKEVVEVQKQQLRDDIDSIKSFLDRDSQLSERSLSWVEKVHEKKVQLQNDEIKLQCFEDGKRRTLVPLGKTPIGGLSEDGLHYMLDRMTSKERFITASTLIAASGMSLSGDDGTSYYFSDGGDNFLRVAHDGSVVEHQVRDTRTGFSTEEPSFKLPGTKTEGFATKPTESSIDMPGIEGGIKYQDPGLRYASKVYHINDDGSGWTAGNETKIGGEANLGFSVDPSGASIGVDASVAQVGAKVTDFPAPERIGGAYRQKETGISGGISLSASASVGTSKGFDGSTEYGVKVPFAKIGMVLEGRVLPESYYPQSIRDRLK